MMRERKLNFCALTQEAEWRSAYPAIQSLYPNLSEEDFISSRSQLIVQDYVLLALKENDEVVSVAGVQPLQLLAAGKILWLFDMATYHKHQSKGYGTQLLKYVEQYAQENGYTRVLLHTALERTDTIRFYNKAIGKPFGYVFRLVTRLPNH